MSTDILNKIADQVKDFDATPMEEISKDRHVVFKEIVDTRRSVRKFTEEKIPDEIVNACIDMALLAPNSSNLQPWQFYRVVSPEKKKQMHLACFGQNAAGTAAELIVCVATPKAWKAHCKEMVRLAKLQPDAPKLVLTYYEKLAPFSYYQGPLSLFGYFKKVLFFFGGFSKAVPREPTSHADMRVWAHKTVALAAQNLMMAFRAYGYDTCPMEGMDSKRVRKIIGAPCGSEITMVIGAGRRSDKGVYGERIRFPRENFVFEV